MFQNCDVVDVTLLAGAVDAVVHPLDFVRVES